MKHLLILSFLFTAASSSAQTTIKGDTVSFCFIKYEVPPGCKTESAYQVKCDDYSMSWIYLTPESFQTMPDQVLKQMSGQVKKFKKERINCYLLDTPAKGYKISFKTEQGTQHQLMAYGFANEQLVLVQLSLNKEPRTNDDIPAFARQMIRLTR
jgi:hypothetical protein